MNLLEHLFPESGSPSSAEAGAVMRKLRAVVMIACWPLLALGLTWGASPAGAYCSVPGGWFAPVTGIGINMAMTSSVEPSWYDQLLYGAAEWVQLQDSTFDIQFFAAGQWPFGAGGAHSNIYSVDFAAFGWEDEPGTISGVTILYDQFGNHVYPESVWSKANVGLNSRFKWNGIMDQANSMADLQTVFGHEVGHVAGLDHPDENWLACDGVLTGAELLARMNPRWDLDHSINADDLAGMQARY